VVGYFEDPARADLLVEWLLRPAPPEYTTAATGISRAKIVHWRAGRATPSLEDVLALVHHLSCATVQFFGILAHFHELPTLALEVRARRTRAELLGAHPAVEAVLACLELESYAALDGHDDDFVAAQVGIDVAEVRNLVGALVELGVIERAKKKYAIRE